MPQYFNMQTQPPAHRSFQLLIIIVIIALIAALFIWRYFDYKITQLKMESTHLITTDIEK